MTTEAGKKIIILYILQILQRYTDAKHPMTQQQIADRLQADYGQNVNRATVKRNINDLIAAGYDIQYTAVRRSQAKKKPDEAEETLSIPICTMSMTSRRPSSTCSSTACSSPAPCPTGTGSS